MRAPFAWWAISIAGILLLTPCAGGDGWWFIEVQLTHGHHRYRFLVDDKPVLDPQGTGIARNERNEQVSLLAVS